MVQKIWNAQFWPFQISFSIFAPKSFKKINLAKLAISNFFLQNWAFQICFNHSNAKILEEIQNDQNWAFQICFNHSNTKILEEVWNGQNLGIPNFLKLYWWKKIGINSEQVKLSILNISEPFWCKTIGRSSEKCKVYIGPMTASETAVAITQWECCPVSPNIVAIAITQWEPALSLPFTSSDVNHQRKILQSLSGNGPQ